MIPTPYRLADVPDGWTGWIRGRIAGADTLVAPLSSRRCVYFHLLAKADDDMAAIGQRAGGGPLTLDDGTGRAIVDLAGAYVHVRYDVIEQVQDSALLRSVGVRRPYLLREGVLEAGQELVVHGRCQRDVDRDPRRMQDYRSPPPTLVRIVRGAQVRPWVTEVE